MHRMQVVIAYFLIYVVWGSTYYFIGVCLRDLPPFVLGAVRFSVAGGALLAVDEYLWFAHHLHLVSVWVHGEFLRCGAP